MKNLEESIYNKLTEERGVLVYRALPASSNTIRTNDYVTKSKRFAKDHAETSAIYNGEPFHVVYRVVPEESIEDADNPGEYKYIGSDKSGIRLTVSVPNDQGSADFVVASKYKDDKLEEIKKPNPKDHTTLSIEDMEKEVRKAQSNKATSDNKKLLKNIPGDEYRKLPTVSDKFQIIVPMSTKASCLYGAGTKWCTAASEDNQFNRYYNRWGMTLYYVLPKKVNPDWAVDADAENDAFQDDEDFMHFFTEGKVQDLQKKYPDIDVTALKDPSGKNKYLAWMAKTVDGLKYDQFGIKNIFGATSRVNDLIADYHKLLPYIGREEKPEKKKEKASQKQTRFDKVAIVMHPEGYRSKMYDAQDKDIELKDLISFIMPTWGIDAKEGLDVFGAVEDAIIDDMADNPNPVGARVEKIKKEIDVLRDELNSNYHDNLVPNFFNDPEKASESPVAYGLIKNTTVESGKMTLPYTSFVYLPIPDAIGGYEKITKDRSFRGNDRARVDDFMKYLRTHMDLWKGPLYITQVALKSFMAAKEKYDEVLSLARRPNTFNERTPREAHVSSTGRADKQQFVLLDTRANILISDGDGNIPAEEMDEVMLNILGDLRAFMETSIPKLKEESWGEFKDLAEKWIKQNPRKSPEEEKAEIEKSTDDIMAHLPEEKRTMSLEEKILAKLMGEELLLEAVDYKQAQAALTGKPAQKLVKSFNFDQGKDPMDNMSKRVTSLKNIIMTTVPHDVLPAAISNDPSVTATKKEEEIEDRRAIGIMWMLRLLKKDKQLTKIFLGDDPHHQGQSQSRAIRQDMEKFFQHPRHMKVRDLDQIQHEVDLNRVVNAAQKTIDAENDKKMGANAGVGTEFFTGGFKYDDEGAIMRDEQGIPLFEPGKDGWVIAAAHNKGAACLLGKETNWCTASPGLNYFDTYYNGEDDPLFFIHTPGSTVAGEEDSGDRFQFAFGCDDCPQFMDVEDTPVQGDEFERLHDKLKEVLAQNGLEERFDVVFNYEHFDYREEMDKITISEKARIDNPQVQIYSEVDEDYDSVNLIAGYDVSFVYSFDGNIFAPVDDLQDEDDIAARFSNFTQVAVGSQDDDSGSDVSDNITYHPGRNTVKITFSGWKSVYAESQGQQGKEYVYEIESFFGDINSSIDGNYEELKAQIARSLIELGALPYTKYDKMLGEMEIYDGEHASQDDEEEGKTTEVRQKEYEDQFKKVLVGFDLEDNQIRFQGLNFPPPEKLANGSVKIKGDVPRDKRTILRRALNVMKQVMQKQPNLPGMDDDTEGYFDMFEILARQEDIVGYFYTFSSMCKIEIDMNLGTLTEPQMNTVTEGMKIIDENFKLFQICMRDALARYIDRNPQGDVVDIEPEDGKDPITGRRWADVRAEGLSEIVTDEVTRAMNEIEPYQKKAKKLQKKAMKLSIKGPNKYMTKGMKIATAKPGKSAPPGV